MAKRLLGKRLIFNQLPQAILGREVFVANFVVFI